MNFARLFVASVLILVVAAPLAAQEAQSFELKVDGWRGLVLDQTTPADAVRLLGTPASDKTDRVEVHNVDKWVAEKRREKIFRKLVFKKLDPVERAELYFLDDKLVMIRLWYGKDSKLPAREIPAAYGADFLLVESGVPKDSTPAMYEGQKESLIPKVYPTIYYMVTVAPSSFVSAAVMNGSVKSVLKEMVRKPTTNPFPGKVLYVEMVSRRLEKSANKSDSK